MPDREKVIKGLDVCLKNIDQPDCPNDCPYFSDCSKYENRVVFQPLMRDALALLKEKEPVKPVQHHVYTTKGWFCGACDGRLNRLGKYCGFCGREVKWE